MDLKKKVGESNNYLYLLKDFSDECLSSVSDHIKTKVLDSLENKKSNLEKLLANHKYTEILKEIHNEILNNIKQLNKIIKSYFETFNEKTNKTINNVKSLIGNDSKKKKNRR